MNFGDQYSYQVVVSQTGASETAASVRSATAGVKAAASATDASAAATARARDELGRFVATNKAAAAAVVATTDATRASGFSLAGLGAALGRAGPAMLQFSQLAEDAQYGVRGLANNIPILVATLGGFTPAAQLAAAASSLLVVGFRGVIEEGLAAAGILDENLVKAMERAEEKSVGLAEAAGVLERSLDRGAITAARWGEALKGVVDATDFADVMAGLDELARSFAPPKASTEALERELDQLEAKAEAAGKSMAVTAQTEMRAYREAAEEVRDEITRLADAHEAKIKASIEQFRKELDKGGESAEAVIEQLAKLRGENDRLVVSLRAAAAAADPLTQAMKQAAKEQADFADAIKAHEDALLKAQRARWDEAEAARQEENRAILESIRLEDEAEAARKARVRARREEEARGRLDANTRRVVEAFGPALSGQIGADLQAGLNRGGSPEQAGMQTFARLSRYLERLGVESGAAGQAARQLIDEQLPMFQRLVDSSNAQAMMTRDALSATQMAARIFEQNRAVEIENRRRVQAIQDWAARNSNRNRSNMLGTFRPF